MLSEEHSAKKQRERLCHQRQAVSPTADLMLGPSPHSSFFKKNTHFHILVWFFCSITDASFLISLHLIPECETSKHGAATVHKIVLRDSCMPSSQEMHIHPGHSPITFPLSKLTLKLSSMYEFHFVA